MTITLTCQVIRHNVMTVGTPVISKNIHNICALRQLNVRIYRLTPNLDRAVPRLADADQVMALKFEGIIKIKEESNQAAIGYILQVYRCQILPFTVVSNTSQILKS